MRRSGGGASWPSRAPWRWRGVNVVGGTAADPEEEHGTWLYADKLGDCRRDFMATKRRGEWQYGEVEKRNRDGAFERYGAIWPESHSTNWGVVVSVRERP